VAVALVAQQLPPVEEQERAREPVRALGLGLMPGLWALVESSTPALAMTAGSPTGRRSRRAGSAVSCPSCCTQRYRS